MKNVFEHIEHIKTKPHHIRKQVAFGVASVGSGLVALVWLGSSLATGAFAIQETSFAESIGKGIATTPGSPAQNIAGAAAALPVDNDEPRIEIVNVVATSSAPVQVREETILPF